ncbi:calcium/calmodulin-dependent protein kinase kinase 2 [Diaporthe helianthi]|uniref:Calcium/calmodulin-dependent protein kinase kinase 2 n=1 Tax=Diaporthe helianthi TaxID=158607 RepID=A0A2P5I2E6_DIAHE|nr:calcium/calmodulin-dependent protein kinase kinase 2 [Diaporthe helianthi]
MRHHKRTPSQHRVVKETLNARSEYTSDESDGRSHHVINQYTIKEEIGRGSYGAVHLAVDQFGNEYPRKQAVKEFSKTRLRKRAQSNILRRGPRRGPGRFPPQPRTAAESGSGPGMDPTVSYQLRDHKKSEANDSLFLIREEIAIMKKLNHPNLVSLIEVLDDPDEDSLYMVLEMCKKGVVMKVGLDQAAEPYSEETCRYWFRDLILGIEYLHAQGVVHRDIKPDNLLLTEDDVLKIVDFGVSEMFEKPEDMRTNKSAGSPAFLPPELCVAKHGDVSGTAADVWSMGVSLYCLRYGHIPFNRAGVLEIYEAIKTETPLLAEDETDNFRDLILRLMEKDPEQRITMPEIREHPWVTRDGTDPLLAAEENCSELVEAPNELEVSHAFTRRMGHLLCVMKAITNFKSLLSSRSRTNSPRTSLLPEDAAELYHSNNNNGNNAHVPRWTRHHKPKPSMDEQEFEALKRANEEHAARLLEQRKQVLQSRGGNMAGPFGLPVKPPTNRSGDSGISDQSGGPTEEESGRSHGERDPDASPRVPALLGIGTGGRDHHNFAAGEEDGQQGEGPISVADSPTAVDFNVYDRAYEEEVARIKRAGGQPSVYMTWHLGAKDRFHEDEALDVREEHGDDDAGAGFAGERGREKVRGAFRNNKFAELVSQTIRDTRAQSQEGGGDGGGGDEKRVEEEEAS